MMMNLNKDLQLKSSMPNQSFFGVFDGHGGVKAARFAAYELPRNIASSKHFKSNLAQAINDGTLKTDHNYLKKANQTLDYSGTTVICAFIRGDELVLGNLGDSR